LSRTFCQFIFFFVLLLSGWACKPFQEKENPENGTPVDCTFSLPDLSKINRFILNDPNNAKLYRIRSQILLDSGRYQEALSDARNALTLDPQDLYNFVVVGKAHRSLGHIDSALSACHTAEKLGFDDPDNQLLLGDLYLIVRRYKESLDYLNKALKKAPFEPRIYYLKGVVFWEKKDTAKALSNWQTSIEQDVNFGDGYARLASYYMEKKEYATAEQYLRSGLRLRPNDAFLYYDMGVFLYQKGFADSAINCYETAIRLDDRLYLAKENLAFLLYRKGKNEEVISLLNSALPLDSKNPALSYYLGLAYRNTAKFDLAAAELNRTVQLNKDYVKEAGMALERVKKLQLQQRKDSLP
jgi:tetratricopeptide (TPR) repeat protein